MSAKYGWTKTSKTVNGCFSYRRTRNGKKVPPTLWTVRYRGPGQIHRRSGPKMAFDSQEEALEWRTKEEARNGSRMDEPPLFGDGVDRYIKARIRAGKLVRSYQYLADRWKPVFKTRKIESVGSTEISNYLDKWQEEGEWTGATRNRVLHQLSGFFSHAIGQRWIDRHPTERGRVETVEEAGARKGYLTLEEAERVIAKCDPWLGNIVRFAIGTGMRLGEVTSLTRASFQKVHLKAGDESVPVCIIEKTKNREPLVFPMSGWPLDYVEARVEKAQLPTTPLFPGPAGRGARMAVLRYLPKAVRAAGLRWGKYLRDEEGNPLRDDNGNKVLDPEGITFHATRHSMASLAKEAGLSTEEIMLLGNWKTAKVVEGYAHATTKMTVNAAARMANVIKPKRWEKSQKAEPKSDRSLG